MYGPDATLALISVVLQDIASDHYYQQDLCDQCGVSAAILKGYPTLVHSERKDRERTYIQKPLDQNQLSLDNWQAEKANTMESPGTSSLRQPWRDFYEQARQAGLKEVDEASTMELCPGDVPSCPKRPHWLGSTPGCATKAVSVDVLPTGTSG
ncbi:hypothetical protein O1611_g64 [Lasiodiplodia mahajangana]|uniref:Uncharacterized protein n=1 Tax=Lasiodiplodia mahajangana TaxID=1108764 RepID=A0ACC2K1M4_9PEZI|nr:hypothetical protein O1611_g64 [Lasiodiplodia mahajangana]